MDFTTIYSKPACEYKGLFSLSPALNAPCRTLRQIFSPVLGRVVSTWLFGLCMHRGFLGVGNWRDNRWGGGICLSNFARYRQTVLPRECCHLHSQLNAWECLLPHVPFITLQQLGRVLPSTSRPSFGVDVYWNNCQTGLHSQHTILYYHRQRTWVGSSFSGPHPHLLFLFLIIKMLVCVKESHRGFFCISLITNNVLALYTYCPQTDVHPEQIPSHF